MGMNTMVILAGIGIAILGLVVRYIIRAIFNKAGDAMQNKIAERQNRKSSGTEEDLSNRYK